MNLREKLELLRELTHDPEVRPFIDGSLEGFGEAPEFLCKPAGWGKSLHCIEWAAKDPAGRTIVTPTINRAAVLFGLADAKGIELHPSSVEAMTEIKASGPSRRIQGPVAIDDMMDVLMIAIGPRIEILTHRTEG